jgi:hypothetical protein
METLSNQLEVIPNRFDISVKNQEIFCAHYLASQNVKKSFLATFPQHKGKNWNTIRNLAHRYFNSTPVQEELKNLLDEIKDKYAITSEKVIQSIAESAFFNPSDLFDENGNLIPIHQLPSHCSSAIQNLQVTQTEKDGEKKTVVQYKFVDKNNSRIMLSKYLKLFDEQSRQEQIFSDIYQGILSEDEDNLQK